MDEFVEYVDEDEIDDLDDLRNARDHRTVVRIPTRRPRRTGTRVVRPVVVRPSYNGKTRRGRSINTGPVIRRDTGNLSYGTIIEAAAQVLAAIQSLPAAPVASGKVETDVGNMMLYQTALAEHAKRDEQLRTIGSLASKLLA